MTILKSFDASGLQFGWDQTSIKLAEECLKKYQYVMLDGWRARGGNVHLFFGGVYASCLEHFHKFRAEGVDHDEALENVVREALISTWIYPVCESCNGTGYLDTVKDKHCFDCNPQNPGRLSTGGAPWTSDHNTKTRENLIRTIVWYFEHFKDDPCQTVILSNGVAAVEHSFQLPVDNGIIFSGHLDRLVNYSDNIYIQDQKTTATTITPRYFANYQPDSQITGMYPFAGRAVFKLPVKGVMIDAAQIAVGFSRFERGFIFTDNASLDEWYDDAMELIERTRQATRDNHFPRNRSSCSKYAGCQFRNVCSKSPAVREQFLKADFEKGERWDPLVSRG
jgi:hypothetical protein